jgi:hypothetical protein
MVLFKVLNVHVKLKDRKMNLATWLPLHNFALPPFLYWLYTKSKREPSEARRIIEVAIGCDMLLIICYHY